VKDWIRVYFCYFLTSRKRKCYGCFRFIGHYILTCCFGLLQRFSWSSGAQISFIGTRQWAGMVMTTSAGLSISTSGRVCTSGIAAELRPPRTWGPWWRSFPCDLRRRNVSLWASEQAHGPPIRKSTPFQIAMTYITGGNGFCDFPGLFYLRQSTANRLRMTISTANSHRQNSNLSSNPMAVYTAIGHRKNDLH